MVCRLSDSDIGVTRKDPTAPGKYRPGWEEVLRLVDARAVDVVLVWKWDRAKSSSSRPLTDPNPR